METVVTYFNVETAVTLLIAVSAFATIVTLGMPLLQTDKLGNRMKTVATEREKLRQKAREDMAKRQGSLRGDKPKGLIKSVVERFDLQKMMDDDAIRTKMKQAGFRGQGPLYTFMFFRFAMPPIMFAAVAFYMFVLLASADLNPLMKLGIAFGAAVIGFYAPNIFVQNVISRRQDSIRQAFPDALDLLLICVESGMSIEAAFKKVASEVGSASVELAEELGLTTAELSYLQERRTAYENLAKRTGLDGVKAVVTSLIQAERYGTPLGQALRTMAQENRDMRMAEVERKAAGLPPKLTVPMIAFFLPVLFAVILGPAIIQAMAL